MLTCATCGNKEPEGSRFCGECGAPFAQADQPLEDAAATEAVVAEPPPAAEPRPAPEPSASRLRWTAAGAAVVFLVAGGAAAAVLTLTGEDGSPEATPTEQEPLPTDTSESLPTTPTPTLVDSTSAHLGELAVFQGALNARVRSLRAGVESFTALRQAADALAAHVVVTQELIGGFAPADSTETATLALLNRALDAHLAYANAISGFPAHPRSFTSAQAQAATARAEQVQVAYSMLAAAEPAMSGIALNSFDHVRLLELVPAARRMVDLVPLLVGIRPDDPPGEGRCFGPYGRGSLRVSGVVHRGGYIQCGDDAEGDPSRASGVYRFSGQTFPAGSRLVRITGQAVIDEFSSPSQRGSRVTWTVLYDGTPICSETVVWSGSRPSPRKLDCKIPSTSSSRGFDVRRLEIRQVASLASAGSVWAGLLNPMVVVEVPR